MHFQFDLKNNDSFLVNKISRIIFSGQDLQSKISKARFLEEDFQKKIFRRIFPEHDFQDKIPRAKFQKQDVTVNKNVTVAKPLCS